MLFEALIEELEKAKESAAMTNASFGFPNDRIEVKSVHFGDEHRGHKGDVIHPDEYVKKITDLYRRSWVIPPITRVIELLRLHEKTIRDVGRLTEALSGLETDGLAAQIERLTHRMKADLSG